LTLLLVGYRLYLGKVLFDAKGDIRAKPVGDPVITTLPYILDNPDVLESFLEFYYADHVKNQKNGRA
jgi:hypothetical protein